MPPARTAAPPAARRSLSASVPKCGPPRRRQRSAARPLRRCRQRASPAACPYRRCGSPRMPRAKAQCGQPDRQPVHLRAVLNTCQPLSPARRVARRQPDRRPVARHRRHRREAARGRRRPPGTSSGDGNELFASCVGTPSAYHIDIYRRKTPLPSGFLPDGLQITAIGCGRLPPPGFVQRSPLWWPCGCGTERGGLAWRRDRMSPRGSDRTSPRRNTWVRARRAHRSRGVHSGRRLQLGGTGSAGPAGSGHITGAWTGIVSGRLADLSPRRGP